MRTLNTKSKSLFGRTVLMFHYSFAPAEKAVMGISEDASCLGQSRLVISEPLWRSIKQRTGTFLAVTGSWPGGD